MREEERDEGEDAQASKADMRVDSSDYLARRIPNDIITHGPVPGSTALLNYRKWVDNYSDRV
jgi:hypothetical protein